MEARRVEVQARDNVDHALQPPSIDVRPRSAQMCMPASVFGPRYGRRTEYLPARYSSRCLVPCAMQPALGYLAVTYRLRERCCYSTFPDVRPQALTRRPIRAGAIPRLSLFLTLHVASRPLKSSWPWTNWHSHIICAVLPTPFSIIEIVLQYSIAEQVLRTPYSVHTP